MKYYDAMPGSPAEEYLASRGLPPSNPLINEKFRLGYVADPVRGHEMYKGCLAIPYLRWAPDEKWQVVSIRFRRLDDVEGKPKYMTQAGDRPRLYNTLALLEPSHTVAIAEGECLRGDAEVLTPEGWVRFDRYRPGTEVAQYEFDGTLRFVRPIAFVKKHYTGPLIERENRQRYYHLSTPGHRVPAFGGRRDPHRFVAAQEGHGTARIPRAGVMDGPGIPLTDSEIRLRIAVSADAAVRPSGGPGRRRSSRDYFVFGLKKQRKIDRLRKLLADTGIQASDNQVSGGYTSICFSAEKGRFGRALPEEWLSLATAEQRRMILAELIEWDGNRVPNRSQSEYSSKYLGNAQWVQTMAHTSGMVSTILPRSNQYGEWFKVSILHNKIDTSWQSLKNYREVDHDDLVYCVSVPSTAFLVRMGGCISVTGNCDTIAASVAGFPTVGVPGAQAWKEHFREPFLGYREVLILADGDDAGMQFAETVAGVLPNAKIIPMPDGSDVNSLVLEQGVQALKDKVGI
ncbi:DNA primase/polymerase [Mycobacterium phage Petp2012]|nr:DNA primase/polymerase [Mycobacterium phage Petp2012]